MEQLDTPGVATSSALDAAEQRELAALRAGDEAVFLALVERHQGAMLRVASLYVKTSASAEEVVQEAWIGVLEGLHLFEGRAPLKSWLLRIVANRARTRGVRDARATPISALFDDAGEEGPSVPEVRFLEDGARWAGHWAEPPAPWPDARVESRELVELVQQALATLPEGQRTVMTMRDIDGLESDEVCELLGIAEGNQRVLLHRARSRVRAYLEERLRGEAHP